VKLRRTPRDLYRGARVLGNVQAIEKSPAGIAKGTTKRTPAVTQRDAMAAIDVICDFWDGKAGVTAKAASTAMKTLKARIQQIVTQNKSKTKPPMSRLGAPVGNRKKARK